MNKLYVRAETVEDHESVSVRVLGVKSAADYTRLYSISLGGL